MGALVKLVPASRYLSYFKLELVDGAEAAVTTNGMGLRLSKPQLLYATGKEESQPIVDGILKPNQTAIVSFGGISPRQYEVLFSVNPTLCSQALVSAPSAFTVGEDARLQFLVSAVKTTDLRSFPYLATMFLVD